MTQRTSNTATIHRAIQDDDVEVIFLVAHNLTDELRIGDLSKIDHAPITENGHIRIMESKTLTLEEFVSLLVVGNGCAITDLPSIIPAEHSARLIALGFIADLFGSLRMTAPGRLRIAAGFENKLLGPISPT
jgi:hypothetical protein